MMGYDELSSKRITGKAEAAHQTRPSPWPRRILAALLVIGVGGYFAVNSNMLPFGNSEAGPGPDRAGQMPPVRVIAADVRNVPVTVSTIGTVLANSIVNVKSQIDGPLLSVAFKEGQMVKKGDVLFRIDPAPFEATVRQMEAQVARDQAQLASAQADADRAIMLSDRGIVSTQQRDQLVANAKALSATVLADLAILEKAKLNLGYTTIRSPIDGKTGPYIVHPGNQVHANDQAGLVTITQIQPVKITFNLPQANLPQLQARLREDALIASVSPRNELNFIAPAEAGTSAMSIPVKVDFIDNAVDARSGTIELRATFANPDLRFVPGELVDVSVRLDTLNQIVVVPHEAINVGQNGPFVFVIDDQNAAEMRPVSIAYEDANIAAILSGLRPGDRAVIDGQLRLSPGTKVTIVPNSAEQPAGNDGQLSDGSQAAESVAQPRAGATGRRGG